MPRYPYPPHDVVCLYEHNCPYLDGLSTRWVLGEYRRADDTYHEHLRIIDVLDGELETAEKRIRELERNYAELKAKYQALHQRQFKVNKKKKDGADEENADTRTPNARGKKKRGAPVGHPGWSRPKPLSVDRTVRVPAPTICPHCRSDHLTPQGSVREHIHEDIVVRPRTVVTQYLHDEAFCPQCRRLVVQAAEDELIGAPIGPLAKATAMYLRYGVCIPYRKVEEILRVLFGLSCVPASLVGFDRKATKMGKAIYEDLAARKSGRPMLPMQMRPHGETTG